MPQEAEGIKIVQQVHKKIQTFDVFLVRQVFKKKPNTEASHYASCFAPQHGHWHAVSSLFQQGEHGTYHMDIVTNAASHGITRLPIQSSSADTEPGERLHHCL